MILLRTKHDFNQVFRDNENKGNVFVELLGINDLTTLLLSLF